MLVDNLNKELNPEQLKVVTSKPCNLLILAGAGSGKTRVLVHRIVWLLQNNLVSPHGILAVTFTNKAAKEMQSRIERLLGISVRSLWIGTFHGLAHRLLRIHWQLAKLPETFQILDSDDQLRMIKRIQKDLNLEDNRFPPKQTQYYINNNKDDGIRYNNLNNKSTKKANFTDKYLQEVYRIYETQCEQLGLVDFAEILLRAKELFINNPELKQHYQARFQHVLVDEFQDTNNLQYDWLKLFYNNNYFTMVGDDDQSIYGWRGAKVENIKKFAKDYHDTKTIRLEQNYRSTGNILKAANCLIENNYDRLGKNLWTDGADGELITLYHAFNDIDEARYVISKVQQSNNNGISLNNMAILYRANHQSRQFEENLLKAGIPYKIFGGQRFYERMEIKDALAYLRLVLNPFDDAAFDRVINWPARGIGKQSLEHIRGFANNNNLSLWQAANDLISQDILKNKAKTSLEKFIDLITSLKKLAKQISDNFNHQSSSKAKQRFIGLPELMEKIISDSGLKDHYFKDDKSKNKTRVENLNELITACSIYEQEFTDNKQNNSHEEHADLLQDFLAHAVLESGEVQADKQEDSLNLMTIHTAKGLEFKVVFLVGLEEGLFPHEMCLSSPEELSEERRLCYVGITRAMEKLFLTFCESRRMRGEDKYNLPSRFLKEIPSNLLEMDQAQTKIETNTNYRNNYSNNSYSNKYSNKHSSQYTKYHSSNRQASIAEYNSDYPAGQMVKHSIFGMGVILHSEGSGDKTRVQVKFDAPHGTKWLVAKIAKLELI